MHIYDSDMDEFYQQPQNLVDLIPKHDIKIVMVDVNDVNAHFGGNRSRFENAVGPPAYGR